MDERPRPIANADERAHLLTVDDTLLRYQAAGHARTARAIQKYCVRGDLDCIKEETTFGQRYRITPASVARHLQQIEEISRTKGRDRSRSDAAVRIEEIQVADNENAGPSVREHSRPVADDSRYVAQLETDINFLRDQIARKDRQIEQRDNQIEAMIERDRETNILLKGLTERIPQLAEGGQTARSPAAEMTVKRDEENREPPTGDNSQ